MDDLKYQVDLYTALNEKLMKSEHVYRQIAEMSGNVYLFYDYRNKKVSVDLVGPWDELVGDKLQHSPYDEAYLLNLFLDKDQDLFRDKILYMERDKVKEVTIEVQLKNRTHSFSVNAKALYEGEDILEKLITFTDITQTKEKNDELNYLAYYDTLTGFYNKNRFIKELEIMCENAENEKSSVEVLLIDIDDFKKINDTIGLSYGDELVQELAVFLKNFEEENVKIGRFGSDLFVMGIYNPCGQRTADNIYRAIREKLRNPFILSNKQIIDFTISAGVAEYPDSGRSALEIVKNAEIVLYAAKDNGRNQIVFFEPEILTRYINDASIEKQLKTSVSNNEFVLYFQPQFSSENGKLRGVETLLRWPDLNGGFISSPEEFIPIAEKNGIMVPIGEWVIKESMRIYSELRSKFHYPMVLSINISKVNLKKDNFVELIQNLLHIYEINPGSLELELTEDAFTEDTEDVISKLNVLRKIGVKISLDDFLTGASSMTLIKKVNFDTIKIDTSVIDEIVSDERARLIVNSIIELCDKLSIRTIAEGVERKEELLMLQKMNCSLVQGNLLGKAMKKSDFEKVIIRQLPD